LRLRNNRYERYARQETRTAGAYYLVTFEDGLDISFWFISRFTYY